jgi:hypothetical protein
VSFELTINRVGAFAGTAPQVCSVDEESLGVLFQRQLEAVVAHPVFSTAQDNMMKLAAHREAPPGRPDDFPSAIRIREAAISGKENEPERTLIGTLPGRRFICTATSRSGVVREWILHVRASITACALQTRTRHTKLWWTFEGVPSDDNPTNRPSEEDIAAFVELTDRMADEGMIPLYQAYRAALADNTELENEDFALRSNRIRIRMSDSTDYAVEALMDAVHYQGLDADSIRKSPDKTHAQRGLCQFEKFVRDVTWQSIDIIRDKSLRVDARFDGFKGIFYKVHVSETETIVAGFGQQSGSVSGLEGAVAPEKRRLRKGEDTLRAMTASRPISASLADQEASLLEPTG